MTLALTAFLTGLFSGVHCVAMCGGVVSALSMSRGREVIRIEPDGAATLGAGAGIAARVPMQLAYSGGRIVSYGMAGAIRMHFQGATTVKVRLGADGIERALLLGSCLLVLGVELLNSAIEAVIERYGAEHHELAGRAKDMGSAAVFMLMLNVVLTWGLILGPRYS